MELIYLQAQSPQVVQVQLVQEQMAVVVAVLVLLEMVLLLQELTAALVVLAAAVVVEEQLQAYKLAAMEYFTCFTRRSL
jgi:hypothetical protein